MSIRDDRARPAPLPRSVPPRSGTKAAQTGPTQLPIGPASAVRSCGSHTNGIAIMLGSGSIRNRWPTGADCEIESRSRRWPPDWGRLIPGCYTASRSHDVPQSLLQLLDRSDVANSRPDSNRCLKVSGLGQTCSEVFGTDSVHPASQLWRCSQ